MIHLGKSKDGRLILASNEPMPADVKRVEYYRDQKLFMMVFENQEDQLLNCEMPDDISEIIKKSPNIVVIVRAENNNEPLGYEVPLVQIGL